jgi:hypothetical protein
MQKHSILTVLAIVGLVTFLAVPVAAHHGWGGQAQEESTLTGTLAAPVSLSGPHATMKIKAADGQVWDITMAPPARTAGAGLKEGIIPLGATVTVRGHKNTGQGRFEMKTEVVQWNNRTFPVYGDRH